MPEKRKELTYDEAVAMLPDGDEIHTFLGGSNMLFGADHSRSEILSLLKEAKYLELAGPNATKMGHGLAVWLSETSKDLYFVETKKYREAK